MQNNDVWSRRTFLKGSAWVAAAGIASPLLASCGASTGSSGGDSGSSLDGLKKQGFVNVGVFGSPVWGYTDKNGRVTGESPEVARVVFARLGVSEIKATQVSADQLIPGLNAHQFDMVCAGLYITPARCKNALFSNPDYTMGDALLVPKGNPQGVKSLQDVAARNVKIALVSGTPEKDYALAAGVKAENIVLYDNNQAILDAVASGRAYAAEVTELSMKQLVQQNSDKPVEIAASFKPVVNGKPVENAGAFVFRQDAQALVDAFNKELEAIHDNGEWLKIVQPFGFTEANLPPKGLTAQQLCSAS